MSNDFIQKTLDLLRYSDIGTLCPSIESAELLPDGRWNLGLSFFVFSGGAKLGKNLILGISILFDLLDALVDNRLPELNGQSFRQRCRALPISDDYEIIFRELYRIMTVLRNTIVHSKDALLGNDGEFVVDREHNGTHYKLTITRYALRLVFSLVVLFAQREESPHVTAILRNYYDDIMNGITAFSDSIEENSEDGSECSLLPISEGLRLKRDRYRVKNSRHDLNTAANALIITSRWPLDHPERRFRSAEYCVSIDGKIYVVPDEALNDCDGISISDLNDWIYDKDRFFN